MSKPESPITTFTRKLKEHKAFRDCPNKSMVYLIYLKLLLSEPFRIIERKKYREKYTKTAPGRSPVFIIGHWRSGTTYLHNLMSSNPHFIYQTKYQNFFSDNFLTTEEFFKPFLSRILNFFSPVSKWKFKTSKTMDLDTPSESDTALISEISEVTYHWAHLFPQASRKYFDKYLFLEKLSENELIKWKQTMKILLNKVYLKKRAGKLLIKNPGDTARIQHLLDIYPDAKFIFIHRNPYDVFYSNLKLWSIVANTVSLQKISERERKDIVLYVYQKLHQKYLEQKKLLRPGQLIEIRHENLIKYPLDALQQIYEKLGLEGFEEAAPFFYSKIEGESPWRKGTYQYQSEDIAEINEKWDFAFDLWHYQKWSPEKPGVGLTG